MREFFRGWRRKAGLTTLVMALLLTAAWVRSYLNQDHIIVYRAPTGYRLSSRDGRLHWVRDQISYGQFDVWSVPYWSLAMPATLLSGYLLLTKPRPTKSAKESNRA